MYRFATTRCLTSSTAYVFSSSLSGLRGVSRSYSSLLPPFSCLCQSTPPTRPPSGGLLRTNGDVIKFGAAIILGAFAFKAGLQAAGIPDLKAGQLTTGLVSVTGLVGWVGTYFYRVGSKKMTYATQLREYEAGVIAKRYAELTPEELDALAEELESEKGS